VNLELHRKKLSAAIILITLALSALFLARGTTSLVAGALLPVSAPKVEAPRGTAERPPGTEPPDGMAILHRNIFDPTTGPLPKPPEPEADPVAAEPPPPAELRPGEVPPPCEGSTLKLVAAVYSEKFPEWSFVTLTAGTAQPLLYRKGGRVEENEVYAIYPKAVFLRQGNGRFCSLSMFAPPPTPGATPNAFAARSMVTPTVPPATTPPPTIAAAIPGATGGISEEELNQNVTAVSETKYNVQRTFVDKILQNQAEIMRSARIVPHEENGQVVGVKLYGIRRNSLLGKLGLQNGDLLRTINGYDMASPDSALEAYARLRSATNLSVSVTRRGRPMALDYNIQQ
jgi:general secretion pathway protein C